jgi:hypothetical protein
MRVIELSDTEEAAAYCGKLHARWGAEVIRVEHPGRPSTDPGARGLPPRREASRLARRRHARGPRRARPAGRLGRPPRHRCLPLARRRASPARARRHRLARHAGQHHLVRTLRSVPRPRGDSRHAARHRRPHLPQRRSRPRPADDPRQLPLLPGGHLRLCRVARRLPARPRRRRGPQHRSRRPRGALGPPPVH